MPLFQQLFFADSAFEAQIAPKPRMFSPGWYDVYGIDSLLFRRRREHMLSASLGVMLMLFAEEGVKRDSLPAGSAR
jgi:hypothetical protein